MRCKNCGENVIKSDICGDYCVHCYGISTPYKETYMTCFWCGEEAKVLSNDLCLSCFREWDKLSIDEREDVIKNSWNRRKA